MTLVLDDADVERLRSEVTQRLGLHFPQDKLNFLGEVGAKRLLATDSATMDHYLSRLGSWGAGLQELRELAEALTVTETFFLRNVEHFRVFADVVVARARTRGQRRLRVLSAGCASGEEPYSLAITLREALPDFDAWEVSVLAVDMNPAMLKKAQHGVYGEWSLRATPEPIKRRYFEARGREFLLSHEIRRMVSFEERNLAVDSPSYWSSLACDAVFCRNVLMYFTPAVMQSALGRLEQALLPGGYLFLGHAETVRGMNHELHLCHTHETFYYQRRIKGDPEFAATTSGQTQVEAMPAFASEPRADSTDWIGTIQQSSDRILSLTSPRTEAASGRESSSLDSIFELVEHERFSEALAELGALPEPRRGAPDALLLSGVLLTNLGQHVEAEVACKRLLELDELHAGAHYLIALCREHAQDFADASQHARTAIYLDPSFAMPHLHLGLMAKRRGDRAVARRELGQALALLGREEAARLRLFGGGFSREGLMRLCAAELSDLGLES